MLPGVSPSKNSAGSRMPPGTLTVHQAVAEDLRVIMQAKKSSVYRSRHANLLYTWQNSHILLCLLSIHQACCQNLHSPGTPRLTYLKRCFRLARRFRITFQGGEWKSSMPHAERWGIAEVGVSAAGEPVSIHVCVLIGSSMDQTWRPIVGLNWCVRPTQTKVRMLRGFWSCSCSSKIVQWTSSLFSFKNETTVRMKICEQKHDKDTQPHQQALKYKKRKDKWDKHLCKPRKNFDSIILPRNPSQSKHISNHKGSQTPQILPQPHLPGHTMQTQKDVLRQGRQAEGLQETMLKTC